jgi:hypothetical protein
MKLKSILFAISTIAITGNVHSANVTVYDNSIAYSAAAGSEVFLIDFNGSAGTTVDGSTISADATFGSPEAANPNLVLWNSDALSDAGSTLVSTSVGPLSIDFTDPLTFAFSLDFSSAGEQETLELYDSSSTLITSVLAPNASGFFGLISDTAIDSVIIRNGIFPSGDRDRFFIDNLRVNAVPVPAAIWLFGSGIVALVGFARKNRKTL